MFRDIGMITTLTGANSFMLHAELRNIVSDFIKEYSDMGLERLDGEEVEYDRIRESLESLPFLASKKLVVLRSGSANKQFVEHADRLLKGLPETTDVVLIEPKLDKRTAYYKLLKKISEFKEYSEMDGRQLAKWLVGQAKEQGAQLTETDANTLVDRVGINQQLLSNELSKLILYNPIINRESIELLTDRTPQSTIFDLLEAAMSGKTKYALELYNEQRQLKVEPVQIIALLSWQLHVLALIKTADGRDANQIASEAKLNPYVVRKSMAIAQRITLAELKQLVTGVRTLDMRLKSESIDPDEAMMLLIMGLNEPGD